MQVLSLGREVLLEKEVATHSSISACEIARRDEPGEATVHGVAKNQKRLKRLSTAPHSQNLGSASQPTSSSFSFCRDFSFSPWTCQCLLHSGNLNIARVGGRTARWVTLTESKLKKEYIEIFERPEREQSAFYEGGRAICSQQVGRRHEKQEGFLSFKTWFAFSIKPIYLLKIKP